MPAFSDSIVLIGGLAVFIERFIETAINIFMPDKKEDEPDWPEWKKHLKRLIIMAAMLGLGALLVFGLDLRLMKDILPNADIGNWQDKALSALVIGGGSAPAHELIRYIEEKKKKAEAEKVAMQADAKVKKAAAGP